jgi:glycosyltransferase involved in cell wall biosynthesis
MVLIPLRSGKFKGAEDGLRMLDILHSNVPNARLVAFGNLERKLVPRYVDYYYQPSSNKLLELYNRSSVFVLPSIVEGFPTPPLEAMACGCALVTTHNGGTDIYSLDKINSLICEPGEPEKLAFLAEQLLKDDILREKISEGGREICKKYSIDKTKEQFVNFMKKEIGY